ncbi:putative O-methyltransferase YrrM [Rhizobium petrolearium]|uniref:class I SAM-dependent methyltransferase n=1 Tax=Neorhizobium petrolearium TaxID=515361 RepID=UPI001AE54F75|nr:class I SAM-dependent methyltransferase [Neorhizobium petrolearium]MBP1843545.1 putative O-methyltransferase YrrM [Neorhizobium petrolearium]
MGLRTFLGLKRVAIKKKDRPPVNAVLWQRAAERSADFIEPHLKTAMLFDDRTDLHRFVFDDLPKAGLLLEFGVFEGKSINFFAKEMRRRGDTRTIFGFDAFEGLQEHWHGIGYHRSENHFNQSGVAPEVGSNVELVKGWIDETLPAFLEAHSDSIAFIHIDTDTYLPAKAILAACKHRLTPGSLILFDELIDYPGWEDGEYRALKEEIDDQAYEWVGFAGWAAMLRVKA